jgi:hypothetical protein
MDMWWVHAATMDTCCIHTHPHLLAMVCTGGISTPVHYLLLGGIWVAMHGVASYAHLYMGYEMLAVSLCTSCGGT